MNGVNVTDPPDVALNRPPSQARSGAVPPKAIQLLLPVWGQRYLKQFLNTGLPSLLAPGNLPALARALPCEFVFLTSSEDAEILREHPACQYLASICDVDIRLIDDLITGDNHSTTITMAYARAVQAAGDAMLDTCFFFLISDYLVADGSLSHVLARILAGASGVLAGNFQVVEEDASKSFHLTFDRGRPELVLPPRALMRWALPHLHPATAGNTVNFPLCHNTQSNRLFWRVDDDTLLGRFYLMHMICIRPETTDFVVGSSCDYSFIPEMCPSDNVEVVTDSDDYLVVEMQPRKHENEFLQLGRTDAVALADTLAEWVTVRHRKNADFSLIFHAADIPPTLPRVLAEADAFLAKVDRRLGKSPPHSHRSHPYWVGAVIAHRLVVNRKQGGKIKPSEIYREYGRGVHVVQRLRDAVFGRPPAVRPWHPRWADYHNIISAMRRLLSPGDRLLVVAKAPFLFGEWLECVPSVTTSMETRQMLTLGADQYAGLGGGYNGCLLIMGESEMRQVGVLMQRISPLLVPGGFIAMAVISGRSIATDHDFGSLMTRNSTQLLSLPIPISKVDFVPAGMLRLGTSAAMTWLYRKMLRSSLICYALAAVLGPVLLLTSFLGNLQCILSRSSARPNSVPTSLLIVFEPGEKMKSMPDLTRDPELYRRAERFKNFAKPVRERASLEERV
jgi:hypothetical protein